MTSVRDIVARFRDEVRKELDLQSRDLLGSVRREIEVIENLLGDRAAQSRARDEIAAAQRELRLLVG